MKRLYYHVYLTDDYGSWAYPVIEQLKTMEDYGLLSSFDDITISCVSQKDQRIDSFVRLLSNLKVNAKVIVFNNTHKSDGNMLNGINNNNTITENAMMQRIFKDCLEENFQFLYIHTKGITSVDKHLKNGDAGTFINYYYWRKFLEWGVIERWRECVRLLENYDIVGVNYFKEPSPHFSGNFWWANSSYIKTLPDPATTEWWKDLQSRTTDQWLKTAPDRFRDEMWPCSNSESKIASLKNLSKLTNLSVEFLPRKNYVG